MANSKQLFVKRTQRVRSKIAKRKSDRPRLSVFRSGKHIYAQVIDDSLGQTLAASSSMEKDMREDTESKDKVAMANKVGKIIGQRAIEKGFKKVVFDRNGFLYHGRVKAVSDGAREAGLEF